MVLIMSPDFLIICHRCSSCFVYLCKNRVLPSPTSDESKKMRGVDKYRIRMLLKAIFLLVLSCSLYQVNGRESKSGSQIKLCGDDFYIMHEYCCKHGCINQKRQFELSGGLRFSLN